MPQRDEPHAYVVRWGLRPLTIPVVGLAVAALLLAVGRPNVLVVLVGLVLLALDVVLWVRVVPRIVKRTVLFAVDSRGVYLGEGVGPTWVPWPEIDAVVRYRRWVRRADGRTVPRWHVGLSRGGRLIADRPVQGWRLDVDLLTAATGRFGRGARVELGPEQGNTPDVGGSYQAYTPLPADRQEPDAYVVRWGLSSLVLPVVLLVVVVALPVFTWPPRPLVWAVVAVFAVLDVVLWIRTVPRLVDRTVVFAVDPRGVYFGQDDQAARPEWVPWTAVDAVVRYRQWTRTSSDRRPTARWHVGVVSRGRIVTDRRVEGWRLDVGRLTAATHRFGNGRTVEQLPDQGSRPGVWIGGT